LPKFWWLPWFPENSWYAYTFATQCIVQSCTMQRNWIKNKLWFWIQKGFNPIMDGLQLSSEFETLLTRSVQQMAEMWKEILLRMAKLLRERAARPWNTKLHTGGFHLHRLVCPFVYQFNFRLGILVHSFQHHFKKILLWFYMKKNVAFTLISFTVLKWDDCLSVQLPFELSVQIPVQLHLELELNWLVQNVIELEFKLSRM
jgi:hypothetical protein